MKKTTIAYLWQDRKRVFGLPLSFTRYRLSEDRLFTSKGFLNVKDDEVLLYRIRDISTSRSLFQRLLGCGRRFGRSGLEAVVHFFIVIFHGSALLVTVQFKKALPAGPAYGSRASATACGACTDGSGS